MHTGPGLIARPLRPETDPQNIEAGDLTRGREASAAFVAGIVFAVRVA